MRFPSTFLDDIRDRLKISDVIGQRVSFDKKKSNPGRGDFWACCPFHGEKTPSFHCEDRKGRYHCFGCGVSGDHFRFLTELDGLSFPEAVERLAAQAGLPMPVMDARERQREEQRATLFDVMEIATRYFEDQLQGPDGAKARAYLRDRGLTSATQQFFRLGYAPDSRNALKEYLASKDIGLKQIEACGLVVHRDDLPVSYDRFRGRIMFPILDSRGRPIAFGGRAMAADVNAKYLNSPETELFHKSNVLYNFVHARKSAHAKKQVISAEGYMDVIALHAAGFDNAVAPLGTALTERQLALLWRMHDEPILCFDGDGAGVAAADRAAEMALPNLTPGKSVRFALLPDGMDPDDLIREAGPSAMAEALTQAIPLAETIWRREVRSGLFDTPEKRAELEARLKGIVGQIRDENVRRHYGQDMQERLQRFFDRSGDGAPQRYGSGSSQRANPSRYGADRGRGQSVKPGGRVAASPSLLNSKLFKQNAQRLPLREAALIAGVCYHPAIAVARFDELAELPFHHAASKQIQSVVLDTLANWTEEEEAPEREVVLGNIARAGLNDAMEQIAVQLRNSRLWQYLPEAAFEDAMDGWMQAYALHLLNHTLSKELKAAETAMAEDTSEETWERLKQIRDEIAKTEGIEALIEGFGVSSGRPATSY